MCYNFGEKAGIPYMFGDRLRALRKEHGYSMDKPVELYNGRFNAKMNKSTLSRYENGKQDPLYQSVVNLATLCFCLLSFLFM